MICGMLKNGGCTSNLYHDAFAEVSGSEVVGTLSSSARPYSSKGGGGITLRATDRLLEVCDVFVVIRKRAEDQEPKRNIRSQTIARTAPKNFLNNSRGFFVVPFLWNSVPKNTIFGEYGFDLWTQWAFLALTEFRGENSVSPCQPVIYVPKRTPSFWQNFRHLTMKPSSSKITAISRYLPLEFWCSEGHFDLFCQADLTYFHLLRPISRSGPNLFSPIWPFLFRNEAPWAGHLTELTEFGAELCSLFRSHTLETVSNQSRKCAINNFWTKNPRGLLGWGSRWSRRIIYVRISPIFEVFSGLPTGLT